MRPKVILSGGQSCLENLQNKGVKFVSLGYIKGGTCLIKTAVRIDKFPNTTLSGPVTLNCKTAVDFANWLEELNAKSIAHVGSYNCRKMRSINIMNEHSFGTAVDISSINGVSVKKDWYKNNNNGRLIRNAALKGC